MTEAEYVREKVLSELLLHSCSNVEKVAFLHLAFKDKTYAKTGVFADEKVRQGMLNKLAASLNISKEDEGVRDKMSEEIHELMSVGVGVKKELFTKSGELCGESWKMASFSAPWVRSVCDEVVFGAGSRKISSFDFEDGDLGYSVVCDSALMNCCGFGAVVRDSVVLGFFPIFSQDAGPADAFRRNLRVKKGKISYVLHTGAGLMNLMVLGSAQVSWDPFRAMQVFKGREARVRFKLPDDMTEVPLYVLDDVQHDEGYCYLTAIRLEYMFLAVRTLGYLPDAEDLLRWFKDSPESERRGCALRFITDDLCHIVYIGGAMSLCEPLARVHPLVQCGAGNSDRIIQNSVEEVYAIVARRGSSAFAGGESGMCGLCQQVVILAEHKLCGGSVLPEVELRGKFSRVMDGVGICLVCLRTVPVDGHQCPGKDVSRGYCYGCFCCVRADGHLPVGDDPGRCKHRRESFDRKRVFLGDAVHTLDVRALVAAFETDRGKLTTVARDYISAGGLLGQRAYLEGVDPEAVEPGRSDHTWGSAFEARYEGSFRINYLGWLKSRLKGNRDVDFAVQDYLRGGSGLLSEMLT